VGKVSCVTEAVEIARVCVKGSAALGRFTVSSFFPEILSAFSIIFAVNGSGATIGFMTLAQNPPPGIYIQLYRGGIRGGEKTLVRYLKTLKKERLPGVIMHGGPQELTTSWNRLAVLAQDQGLLPMVSWGLDSPKTSAIDKGKYMGEVLQRPSCLAGLIDAEAYWDGGARDQDAILMCQEIRKLAPDKPLGDQPWFAIQSHGDPEKGGTFRGFPVDEFALFVTWSRFPQGYCNNFIKQYGTEAYEIIFAWMEKDWTLLEKHLKPSMVRPRSVTIQGYRWNITDEIHCLLKYHLQLHQSVIIWSDPFPDETTIKAIRFVYKLRDLGMTGPGITPEAAIRSFQVEYNKTAKRKISVDGIAGPKTITAAGV